MITKNEIDKNVIKYPVVEKFASINGEGILAGQPAVFIRFRGCNLSCSYCDTAYANQSDANADMLTAEEIHDYIRECGIRNVTLTGGEPLLTYGIGALIEILASDENIHIEIETNGSVDILDFSYMDNAPSFTVDYKLPGSGMEDMMLMSNFNAVSKKDTVKFVAGSIEDLERAREIIASYDLTEKCNVYVSPVFGRIGLDKMAGFIVDNRMNGVRMQLQMHKFIWDPERRGV